MTMLNKRFLTTIFAAGVLSVFILPTTVQAASVVFNNIGATPGTPAQSTRPDAGGPLAVSFTTGSAAQLVGLDLLLRGDNQTTGSTSIDLYSDSGNLPNAFLFHISTLSDSALTSTLSVFTFNSFAPFQLSGNTRYWISVVSDDTSTGHGSSAEWGWSSDISGTGVASEYLSGFGLTTPTAIADIGIAYQMKVTVEANVPEPGTMALMSFGLVGMAFGKRRKLS